MSPRAKKMDTIVGRLKAADPFELIRWLARSQPDPRKALAELVQNSLDAGAKNVQVKRVRERGVSALYVLDDGEGVIPELGRVEALTYVATHVGHSRKRNLTPQERRELLMQGKYGIGLIGFWAIGQVLEMRTKLGDEPPYVLRLHCESPRYEIDRARSRLAFGERSTEIVIRGLHRAAAFSLTARRIAEYLSVELRGQLLMRNVTVLVHDGIARGRSPKVLEVRPPRFEGERLALPESIRVEGFSPLRLELYVAADGGGQPNRICVSSGGTVVYEDLTDFEVADFRRTPWIEPRLTGLVEFPDFAVPPGSRRGVAPDHAASGFAAALASVEPALAAELGRIERRSAADLEQGLLRQLEKAFRDVPRLAPHYDFFPVRGDQRSPARGEGGSDGAPVAETQEPSAEAENDDLPLLAAGPLESLEIVPGATRVERLGRRILRAVARDAAGARLRSGVEIEWSADGALGRLESPAGRSTVFEAGPETGVATISAKAREGERSAVASATVEITEAAAESDSNRAGIPEPIFVDDPASPWRSRVRSERVWEVNSGHPDYRAAAETPRRKLRYLAALLAKEVVLHSFPSPQLGPTLERMVEVLTITERRLERG